MSDERLPIIMELRINDEISADIYEDAPLTVSVSIVNEEAIKGASDNMPLELERQDLERKFKEKLIKEEEYKKTVEEIEHRKQKFKIYRFGGPSGWVNFIKFCFLTEEGWKNLNWPLKLLTFDPAKRVSELDADTSIYAEFGLDPQDSKEITKGEIKLKAIAEIITNNPIESNVIVANILGKKMPKAIQNSEKNLLAMGRYSSKRGQFEKASEYAKMAFQVNPNSIKALILLGKIEEKRGNFAQAFEAFKKAEQKFYYLKENEKYGAPEYIVSQILRLKNLLSK